MNIKRNGIPKQVTTNKGIDLKHVPLDLNPNEVAYTQKVSGVYVDLVLRNDCNTAREFDSNGWKKIKR